MWVIIENEKKKEIQYFRHKFIRYWLCIIKNKIQGNIVEILDDE